MIPPPQNRKELDAAWNKAQSLHRAGRPAEAETLYRQILETEPRLPLVWFSLGIALEQQGRPQDAVKALDRLLTLQPQLTEALANRGSLLGRLGRFDEALADFESALRHKPDFLPAWINKGMVLQTVGRLDAALAAFDQALTLAPGHAEALANRGAVLRALGRSDEALAAFDRVLVSQKANAVAHFNRGATLMDLSRAEEALAAFDAALAAAPDFAPAHGGRGAALMVLSRPEEALAAYGQAPADFEALRNIGELLQGLQRFDEAVQAYDAALALKSDAGVMANRASVLRAMGRMEEARAGFGAALAVNPNRLEVLKSRALLAWQYFKDFDAAIADLEKLVALAPDHEDAASLLLHLQMQNADWRAYPGAVARLEEKIARGKQAAGPFVLQALSSSPALLHACAQRHAADTYPAAPAILRARTRRERLRLGYLCGEFRNQATSVLAAGLFERHDKDRFELFAFDNGASDNSPMRARLENAFEHFVPIAELSDEKAAATVAAVEPDILVSLNGWFGMARMAAFASRSAPIQVNYLGFPGTFGAPYIDYIIADRIVIPEEEKRFYSEQVVWLPDSYQVNDDRRAIGAASSRAAHGLPDNGFVFCNFNQTYKLTPEMFESWMRILAAVPGSVLWLLAERPAVADNLRREAVQRGVEGSRLIFAPPLPHADHLARLRLADLMLDTLPCNGHTTASDALWAGLPLLTCRGTAFCGRVAASLNNAIGLGELTTENLPAFEAKAIALAREKSELAFLRARLGENRATTPLFDTDRYRRHIEAAYETMWEIFAKGEAPTAFAVDAET